MTKTVQAGAGAPAAGRTAAPHITAELHVDLDGVRARYECLRPGCTQRMEGPVYGAAAVQAFVVSIRTDHLTRCTARENR